MNLPSMLRALRRTWPGHEDRASTEPSETDWLMAFRQDGCAVLEGLLPADAIVRFLADMDRLWQTGHPAMQLAVPPDDRRLPLDRQLALTPGARVVDQYVHLGSACRLLLHPRLTSQLAKLFDQPVTLFQSLGFEVGSEQGMHQDSAYVVTTPPRQLLGVWIALEDVAPGSGELQYYAGSHRIGQFRFARGGAHYVPDPCDPNEHDRYERHLESEVDRLDCELRKFRARRGDVLVWHADLVHGGAPILRSGTSRRSLVGHYCPASAAPDYFRAGPERARRAP